MDSNTAENYKKMDSSKTKNGQKWTQVRPKMDKKMDLRKT